MRVDLHTHVVPPRWDDWAARFGGGKWPRLVVKDACHATIMTGDQFFRDIDDRSWDPARRLEDMDRLGIDMQALSPPPVMFCYWAEAKAGQMFARLQNENVAALAARHPRRFVGMATVPLQDPTLAIAELRHARHQIARREVAEIELSVFHHGEEIVRAPTLRRDVLGDADVDVGAAGARQLLRETPHRTCVDRGIALIAAEADRN